MRLVMWTNLWNECRAYDTDGIGTKFHLTESDTPAGKTLCGRLFPARKGFPSSCGVCRRCLNIAYRRGFPKGFTKALGRVESVGDER